MTGRSVWKHLVFALIVLLAIVAGSMGSDRARRQQAGSAPPPAPQSAPAGRGASPFVPPEPLNYSDRAGWTSMFDGRSLAGWSGNPQVWSVENGAITAVSTMERRIGSTHIIWSGGEPSDFELKLEVKLEGDIHSGIAYRSQVDEKRNVGAPVARQGGPGERSGMTPAVPADPKWTLYGPGLDFDYDRKMAGNVEDRGTPRREIAWRGGIVLAERDVRPRLIGAIGDADILMALIKTDDWNQVHIIARGHQLIHIINGQLMTVLIDDDPTYFRSAGLIGLQIEMYGTGRVSFRDIWLKEYRP